ncbi:MAG TPA: o-succinylbenzoate--CoA ligase [Cerasibacillus sp.]|uniref:o-succinylbenzoate--CoA ligase n=1 Tax=Cerasibacillus sp. TaxID=2498711 RepID=UPI002F3F0538
MNDIIPHWLTQQAFISSHVPAIEMENGINITFSELQQRSQQTAYQIAAYGIQEGAHVAILSKNDPRMIITIHALSYLGATVVLLNTRLTPAELQYQIDDANVSLLIYHDVFIDKVKQLQIENSLSFDEVKRLNIETGVALKEEIRLSDPFTIIYTSGTTGFPKGVIHTYGNHWWSAISSALNLGLSKADKWLAVLPFFHVGGLSIFLKSVIYGMPVYLVEKFNAAMVNEAIREKQVTIISVVTVMLQRLLDDLGVKRYPDTFRGMLLGGGPAPEVLLEQAKEKQVPVFQSYGMTETSSQIVTLSAKDALRKIGSSGKPLLSAQLKIHNKTTDGVGEIYVKGPMVTTGYYNNDTANANLFDKGWLKTGDLGHIDSEGFLYVVDRRNDLIISGGENVYPTEIEHVLEQIPDIREVAVVGRKDDTWGEVPVAYVVCESEALTEKCIIDYAHKHLAPYKVPKQILFINQLPRNASNKIMRHQLKAMLHTKR